MITNKVTFLPCQKGSDLDSKIKYKATQDSLLTFILIKAASSWTNSQFGII